VFGTSSATNNPSIKNDLTSGMYTAGGGLIDFSISGTKVGEFSSSGLTANLIGNATNITGVAAVANGGTGTSTAQTAGSIFYANTGGVFTGDATNFTWNDANTYLAVGSPLNLTNYPGTLLSLVGASASGGYEQAIIQNTATAGQGCWIAQANDATNTTHYSQICMNNSSSPSVSNAYFTDTHALSIYNTDAETDFGTSIGVGSGGNFNWYVNQSSAANMTLTSSGLGIGKTNPAAPLDVTRTTAAAIDINGVNALWEDSSHTNTIVGNSTFTATASYAGGVSGTLNVSVGDGSLNNLTTGNANVALGAPACGGITTGAQNECMGRVAGNAITTAVGNIAIGYYSAPALTTGSNNVIIGSGGGAASASGEAPTLSTGSNNIVIGTSYIADVTASGSANTLNIGNALFGTGMTGSTATPAGKIGIGTNSPATTLDVNGGITMETGTAGAILCLTSAHALGHCTAAASCTGTCTCTCTAN